jgi:7-carboxy-7-deazaguanine synthase
MTTLQHVDYNVGPKSYEGFGDKLLITKVFPTIQGEGLFAGQRAVFIRFAGCDRGDKRSCTFCDTDFRFQKGTAWSVEALVKAVNAQYEEQNKLVVITGGEPMLQKNIVPLIEALSAAKHITQIESNGDRLAPEFAERCGGTILVVSPKINPSRQQYALLPPEVQKRLDNLKFVVSADPLNPYHNLPPWLYDFRGDAFRKRVFISPMTVYKRAVREREVSSVWDETLVDHEATELNYRYAARLAFREGYRLSVQLHTLAAME